MNAPAPLIDAEVDLQDFPFMPLHVARLRDSNLSAEEEPEACWYAVLLWAASWHQIPAASLPDNDTVLMRLVGLGREKRTWAKHRAGALRGFVKCSDGRLYHPVVAELAMRAWTRHHRLRHAALRKKRAARIKGSRWQNIRQRILTRDGHRCGACSSTGPFLEIDHVLPLAEGGTNTDDNLQVLCRPCNRRKSYKVVRGAHG